MHTHPTQPAGVVVHWQVYLSFQSSPGWKYIFWLQDNARKFNGSCFRFQVSLLTTTQKSEDATSKSELDES